MQLCIICQIVACVSVRLVQSWIMLQAYVLVALLSSLISYFSALSGVYQVSSCYINPRIFLLHMVFCEEALASKQCFGDCFLHSVCSCLILRYKVNVHYWNDYGSRASQICSVFLPNFLEINLLILFILQGIEMLSLGSFKTGAILLVWVVCTELKLMFSGRNLITFFSTFFH